MPDDSRPRSRFDRDSDRDKAPAPRSRFDRRSRSPSRRESESRRTRSPAGRKDTESPSTAESPKPSIDAAEAKARAAAKAAEIAAAIAARKAAANQAVNVPPIRSPISGPPVVKRPSSSKGTASVSEAYQQDGDYIQDIEINDLRNRYTLTKGAVQKKVNKLLSSY